jgi:hypothetical protein
MVRTWEIDTFCRVPLTVTPTWGAQARPPMGSAVPQGFEGLGDRTKKKSGTSAAGRSPIAYWSRAL